MPIKKQLISIKLGESIKSIRESKSLTQEQLASKAGLYRTYIGQIERAEKNITLVNLEIIAKALDINIKELL